MFGFIMFCVCVFYFLFACVITDPIPEVRTASALAFRSLNQSLGEEALPGIYQWLMSLLEDEHASSVQRFGAAQGFAELMASYDETKINEILPILLDGLEKENANVRESFAQVFVYLPKALNDEFPQYMSHIIPYLLQILADEKEPVRSVAIQAGKVTHTQS